MFETIWDFLKSFIGSRGVQIIARYAGNGLTAAATYFHLTIAADDQAKTATVLGTIAAAGLCWVIDHISHAIQKDKSLSDAFRLPPYTVLMFGLLIPAFACLSGCKPV